MRKSTAEVAEIAETKEGVELNRITDGIIDAEGHRALGPGLLESAYEACLAFEIADRGLKVERQKTLPIIYREVELEAGYRLDLVVENSVAVELKAVDRLSAIHEAKLIAYLKLSGHKVGLLINFNVKVLKNWIRRLVNKFPDSPRSPR